jgi:uncharacterized membrane protein
MEPWLYYALMIALIYTIWTILQEYIIKKHDDCSCINFKIYIIAGLIAFIYLLYHVKSNECKHSKSLKEVISYTDNKVWIMILIIGILIIIATRYWTFAVINNGNSGYVTAVTNISIVFITLYSSYAYTSHLNMQKILGIILMLFGIGLISIDKKKIN